jgi:L-ascorbate metabolism protein UlaG (beta-lactamase superfamily)
LNGFLRASVTLAGLLLSAVTLRASELEITYLANEGVLIRCGGQKILVDALLRDSLDAYARHSPEVQEKLETGTPPFDGVGLALATHFHLDHWDAGAVSRFLRNNPNALFASTPDATAMLPWSQRKQVRALWPDPNGKEEVQRGDVIVSAVRLAHGNTQNLGFRISMCGQTLVHLGDADVSAADFAALRRLGDADAALVPFWWLLDPKSAEFVRKQWKPRHIVALHFATTSSEEVNKVRAQWPEAWVGSQQGQSRKF